MPGKPKGLPKTGGRKKGSPNKTTGILKDAFIEAAVLAGEAIGTTPAEKKKGMVTYLKHQALNNPNAFMSGISRIIPMQLAGDAEDGGVKITIGFE
tara:strand:- start:531 stop:818 length:288 start_codon:yes stop_codon:yes gene_type:complete